MSKNKKVPTSVALDPHLLDRMRKRAVVEGVSASKLMSKALEKYLTEEPLQV